MKTILITGANGFIANCLARDFNSAGFRVLGTSRRTNPLENFHVIFNGTLGQPLHGVFEQESIDCVFHCANHFGQGDQEELTVNIEGTLLWANQAQESGINTQVFLSSLSAKENIPSTYGLAKFQIEKWFISNYQIVLRLGLVIGNGGIFGKMVNMIKKCPLIPLPDNGRALVYPLGIHDLCQACLNIAKGESVKLKGKIWFLHQPSPVRLREILTSIRRTTESMCIFLPIPSIALLTILKVVEQFPWLKLGLSSTNIQGLRASASEEFKSDFTIFKLTPQRLDKLIDEADKPNILHSAGKEVTS